MGRLRSAAWCKSCPEPVFWAGTESGRRLLVNAGPHPDGNLLIVTTDLTGGPVVRVVGVHDRTPDMVLYRPHFATCPNSADYRKGRKP